MKQAKPKHKISILSKLLLLLNIIAVSGLLMAYVSAYIPPASIPLLAFAGLIYPYILIVNIGFVLLWLFSKKRFAVISIVVILLGWNQIGRLVRLIPGSSEPPEDKLKIKVLSYNIQNFHHVNIASTKYMKDFTNENNIVEFIKAQDADIICLQEMLYDRLDPKSFPKKFGNTIGCPNFYYENYYNSITRKLDAIATFTKYKIIKNGHLQYDDKTIGIFNDLIVNGDTVRLYNLHLASIHLRKEDYEFMSDISNTKENNNFKTKTRNILSKLKSAFIKRGRQADIVAGHIAECTYPVIICGDLNDTPYSYTYHKLSKNVEDAFVESGNGLGKTYAGDDFPSLRIDYILHDKMFQSNGFIRHKIFLSDHFPISAVLTVNRP